MSMFNLIFVAAIGLVAAGLVSSAWAAATGEALRPRVLETHDALMPLRVLALVFGLPILLAVLARRFASCSAGSFVLGGFILGGAAVWCFVQGVVILVSAAQLAAALG